LVVDVNALNAMEISVRSQLYIMRYFAQLAVDYISAE